MRSRCHLQIMRRVALRLSGYQKEQSAGPDSGICSGKESSLRLETKAKRIITLFSRLGKQSFFGNSKQLPFERVNGWHCPYR